MEVFEELTAIYTPTPGKSMEIVVCGSGSGSNLQALLDVQKSCPGKFLVKAIFTDRLCGCHEIAKRENIPLIYFSFHQYFKQHGESDKNNTELRKAYDLEMVRRIREAAREYQFSVNLIVLAGYMRLLTSSMLNAFPDQVINVHPGDLTATNSQGQREYVGKDAVYDALTAGEIQTRSCVFIVDEHIDTGPLLVSGPWVDAEFGMPLTSETVVDYQEKQKRQSDWPALVKAVELIAEGKISINEQKRVYIEGTLQGKGGFDMGIYKE